MLVDQCVGKDKGKFIPLTHHEGTERVGVIGSLTLNPDPDGVGGQGHALASFPRENLRTLWGYTGWI